MWTQVEQALNQSTVNVMTALARLLPGTIALVVSIGIAAALSRVVRAALRRALTGLEFDRWMASVGWSDLAAWSGLRSPTEAVARVVSWTILFLGFVVGVAAIDPTFTSQLALTLFGSAMNLLVALLLLAVGSMLARFLARSVVISLVNMNVQQARLIGLGVKWLVFILATAMALDHLGIGARIVELAFAILFGGIVLTLALVVGLRSKDLADWSSRLPAEDAPRDESQPFDHF